ncbi:MAG: hypothetical protein ACREXX_23390, partial [Gammaproteobacteria bacterium]
MNADKDDCAPTAPPRHLRSSLLTGVHLRSTFLLSSVSSVVNLHFCGPNRTLPEFVEPSRRIAMTELLGPLVTFAVATSVTPGPNNV